MTQPIGNTTMADTARLRGVLSYAIDPESAERLWSASEAMTGVSA